MRITFTKVIAWLTFIMFFIHFLVMHKVEGAEATYYSDDLKGRPMANTKPYHPMDLTCASWDYPLGTELAVTYRGRTVYVLVTDRHDYKTDIDLARWPFSLLAPLEYGRIEVTIKEVK